MPRNPFERLLRPLRTRLYLMIARAAVRLVDDGKGMQVVQADLGAGDTRDGLEHFQEYGFTSRPRAPSGTKGPEGIGLRVGGDGAHTVLICVGDRRFRLKSLAEGEVAMYDDLGQVVHMKRDKLLLKSTLGVEIDTPTLEVKHHLHVAGDAYVDGDAQVGGDVSDESGTAQTMAEMRTTFNAHTHTAHGVTSGPSDLPVPAPNPPLM
jgi:phage baseplate assembly protein V